MHERPAHSSSMQFSFYRRHRQVKARTFILVPAQKKLKQCSATLVPAFLYNLFQYNANKIERHV